MQIDCRAKQKKNYRKKHSRKNEKHTFEAGMICLPEEGYIPAELWEDWILQQPDLSYGRFRQSLKTFLFMKC